MEYFGGKGHTFQSIGLLALNLSMPISWGGSYRAKSTELRIVLQRALHPRYLDKPLVSHQLVDLVVIIHENPSHSKNIHWKDPKQINSSLDRYGPSPHRPVRIRNIRTSLEGNS